MFYSSPDGITWSEIQEDKELVNAHFHYQTYRNIYYIKDGSILPTLQKHIFIQTTSTEFIFIRWVNESKKNQLDTIRSLVQSNKEKEEEVIQEPDSSLPLPRVQFSPLVVSELPVSLEVSLPLPVESPSSEAIDLKKAMLARIRENANEMV